MQDFAPESYALRQIRASPYPNRLLEYSVNLPETQIRLLNYIVRWTIGFSTPTPGQRKGSVTVNLFQLAARTKRASVKPVVESLLALYSAGILSVSALDGKELDWNRLAENRYRRLVIGITPEWVIDE
jgi:hypothetical protein